jgi:AraC-like DNA-binding protein
MGSLLHLTMPVSTSGLIARCAVEHCRAAGIDPRPLLRRAEIPLREIEDPHGRIPVTAQVAFLNLAADALNDPVLGFHLAMGIDLRRIGLLYYVLASSATFGEALERGERYCSIANEALCLDHVSGEELAIHYSCTGIRRHTDRHQIEFWTTSIVRLTHQLTGSRVNPIRACFIHAPSAGSAELEAFFGCPVSFGAGEDLVVYPQAIFGHPLTAADPYLNDLLVHYCEEALAKRRRPVEALQTRVENAITPLLPHGRARVDEVARELGMGTRTLSRRLAAEGLTFSRILDDLRANLALRYLAEPSLSVSQVAWFLGFQEVAAFTHAFRRWTGMTPTEARSSGHLPAIGARRAARSAAARGR